MMSAGSKMGVQMIVITNVVLAFFSTCSANKLKQNTPLGLKEYLDIIIDIYN